LRTLLSLVLKDFRRDFKRPWSILLFTSLPVIMTALIALVFGGRSDTAPVSAIHVAVLDPDDDLGRELSRFLSAQEGAAQKVQLHFVRSRDEGVRLVENGEASALVVLPEHLTGRLLNGRASTIEFYENPSEQILPRVVWQGVSLLADGLSGVVEVLRDPSRDPGADRPPADSGAALFSLDTLQRLQHYHVYVFPPLIQIRTVAAEDYQLQGTQAPDASGLP
jgi:hypothetical protein